MFIPPKYKNDDPQKVAEFIKANSFGQLVSSHQERPWVTHIPLELELTPDGHQVLYGHVAKANPQWRAIQEDEIVLAIFTGPHAYISSSWYNHENVPTWNYIAAHVYGNFKILDHEEMMYSLKLLVDKYEKGSENPVSVETMSDKVLRQTKGIVAFKIEITEIQAKHKLSQNRDQKNHDAIVEKLEERGDSLSRQVAKEMRDVRESD